MLIDLCHEIDEIKSGNTEKSDAYKKYQTLKSIEDDVEARYQAGEISRERYESYRQSIEEAEKQMG